MHPRSFDLKLISSRRNPLVRYLRLLSSKEGRNQHSLILLEGTHLLLEALKTSFLPVEIIATTKWLEKNSEIIESISSAIDLKVVTQSVLEASLTTKTPDGVASVFPLHALPNQPEKPDFILALDNLQDPGNVGSLFRTALAAEIDLIWLASGADPLSQKVLRASSGAVLHLPYERFVDLEQKSIEVLAAKLDISREKGFQVIATVVPSLKRSQPIVPYWQIDWTLPTILLLGNEGSGIHSRLKECCTNVITLPHSQLVESLNVASVAVPLLLERRRATISSGIY